MTDPTESSCSGTLSRREAVRFALTAALSESLALGFLDVTLSLSRRSPGALRPLGIALLPVAVSSGAIFSLLFAVLLCAALLRPGAPGRGRGALLSSLAAGLGTFLGLAIYFNVTRLELNAIQARILALVAGLSLAVGAYRYHRVRAAWTDSGMPPGFRAAFLLLPFLVGTGFLLVWGWACRRTSPSADLPGLGVTALLIVGALEAAAAIHLARRVRVERWLGALAILVVAAPIAAWPLRGSSREPPAAAGRSHAVHKVLFLSIDTLRADAVSALNPDAPPTPSLDSLAADSVVFTRAYSPAPWTLPSFVSMMTGVAPPVHGARTPAHRIPDGLATLAERMRDAGYVTAAIGHNPWLRPEHGMSRGFDTYDICPRDEYGGSLGSRLLARLLPGRLKPTLATPEITRFATEWLRGHAREDFFLWLHYFKPHGPYEPPEPYRPREKPPEGMGYRFGGAPAIRMGSLVIPPSERGWVRALYEGEVRFVDHNVGEIAAELKRLGIYDETLIVVASDHGEEFWEHGSFEHGHTLYEELIRVPFFIKLPGQSLRVRETGRVSTGSIYATVLDLCGIQDDPGWLSYPPLTPLLRNGSFDGEPILSSSPLYYEDREAWIRGSTKCIRSCVTDRLQIFDLEQDPAEQRDLSLTSPERTREALKVLAGLHAADEALREHYGIRGAFPAAIDPEALQELRSLGYIR